jgi:hypothetical protein
MKRFLIATMSALFIMANCYSQDVITKTSGDSVQAKVLEISTTEIKYKKMDNQTGPTYSILKSEVNMVRYENGSTDIFTAVEPRQFEGNMGKLCFLRSNKYSGSGITFLMSVDDSLVCKLKSNCYSEHLIKPGEHTITLEGNKFTISDPITVNVLPGRTCYIQLTTQTHFTDFTIVMEKVTDNAANAVMTKLKVNKKCQ